MGGEAQTAEPADEVTDTVYEPALVMGMANVVAIGLPDSFH
jgi:hypothetical protein